MGEIADALRQADRNAPSGRSGQETIPPRPHEEHRVAREISDRETQAEAAEAAEEEELRSARESEVSPRHAPPYPAPVSKVPNAESAADASHPHPSRRSSQADTWEHEPHPDRAPTELRRDGSDETAAARVTLSDPLGEATQQYRRIAFRIRELADSRGAHSIVITSAQTQEGKTTTSCNLAIQLARLDQALRVVLVDLDLHRASIAAAFGIEIETPIDAVLTGERSLDEGLFETDVPGLSMLGPNEPTSQSEWLLAHPNLRTMIQDLEDRFDFVIIDTPPVLASSDAQVILRHASAALFIARAGQSPVKAVRRALEHIPTEKLLGSLLNSSPGSPDLSDYPYYGAPAAERGEAPPARAMMERRHGQ